MVKKIEVKGSEITVISKHGQDYISLTDMLKAKDGDFFISDWLRNRNTIEFLGIWETVFNPAFNYGEFATIKTTGRAVEPRKHQRGPDSLAFVLAGTPDAVERHRHHADAIPGGKRYAQALARSRHAKRNREMTEPTITPNHV